MSIIFKNINTRKYWNKVYRKEVETKKRYIKALIIEIIKMFLPNSLKEYQIILQF